MPLEMKVMTRVVMLAKGECKGCTVVIACEEKKVVGASPCEV